MNITEFRTRYTQDVELFVREVLHFPNAQERLEGKDIYPWQKTIMKLYDRRERRIAVKSGHGVGKSSLAAWLLWHHMLLRYPQRCAVTAPTEKTLFNALWANFRAWGDRLPRELRELVDVSNARAELKSSPGDSFISVSTARADQPEALQGIHSTYGLLWADEGSAVPDKVYEAGQGSMSDPGAMTILTSNPTRGQGYFFDCFGKTQELWKTITVSCLDIPAIAASDFAKQVEITYGRDSNQYRVRVLGEFPTREDDTIIPFELVEPAVDGSRDIIIPKTAPVVWGVDPARFGSDRSALAKRQTKQLLEPIKWWVKLDTMELAARIKTEYDSSPEWLRPKEIDVDSIGVGAGVVDRLRQLNLPARGINVSESPSINADLYSNLRTELWFKCKTWFEGRDVLLPKKYYHTGDRGNDLVGELTAIRYKFRPGSGKLAAESKDEMKKRGQRSPDLGDAFVLTFASDAITLAQGSYGSTEWNQPLKAALRRIV